VAFAWVLL